MGSNGGCQVNQTDSTYPICPHCQREFVPGTYWQGSNVCKAGYLMTVAEAHPGLSAWELGEMAGLKYADASRAMLKARNLDLVDYTKEDRDRGGVRYRFFAKAEWQERIQRWYAEVESLPAWGRPPRKQAPA
jgi:hypothetical protein